MDDSTRSMFQSLLDAIKGQSKSIARLQAFNALQSYALLHLLSDERDVAEGKLDMVEAYERVREAALRMAEVGDATDDIRGLLEVCDDRFLNIYE